MSRAKKPKDAMKFLRRALPIIHILLILTAISATASVAFCADDVPLTAGLSWGMESVHCQQALAAAGFKRMERDYSDEPGDRTLRNIALVHGVREASYEKSEKKYVERVTVYMINELLFRVVVKYEDFVKGTGDIREKIIEEVSKKFHSTPYNVSGLESGIAVYSWTDGVTEARFVYRELPNIDFYFVEVDYYHIDTATKLKKARLLRH